ncbi:glycosyltransferase [Verrucomicrobia bacterium]|nr:glycosyltransferase [Verrucomicrobiota bacterium]
MALKKKILIIQHSSNFGGATVSLNETLSCLCKENITILGPDNIQKVIKTNDKDIKILSLKKKLGSFPLYSGGGKLYSLMYYFNLLKIPLSGFEIRKVITKLQPDILIVNSIILSHVAIFVPLCIPCKKIIWIRETRVSSFRIFELLIQKLLISRFDNAIFISSYDLKAYKLNNKNQTVIPNVYTKHELTKPGNSCNEKLINIFYCGGFAKIKGFFLLCKIVKQLNITNVNIICSGFDLREINKPTLKSMILRRKYKFLKKFPCVEILPYNQNINELYNRSNASIILFETPHQARVIIESGLHHLPVLAPKFKCFTEIYDENKEIIYFKPNSVKDFLKKLEYMISNWDNMKELALRLNEKVTKLHCRLKFRKSIKSLMHNECQ